MEKPHCGVCQKQFSCISARNLHTKNIHHVPVENTKFRHIKCPVCPAEKQEPFRDYDTMIQHLTEVHSVSIKQSQFHFRNMEEFEAWKAQDNKELDYTYIRSVKRPNNEKRLYYDCNRSNSKGYESNCSKRAMKAGGSIKIAGVCPSRIIATVMENGLVSVCFIETHVGHKEARYQNELSQYLEETCENQQKEENEIDFESRRKIAVMELSNYATSLDRESYTRFMEIVATFKNNNNNQTKNFSRKRKIEKQTYCPNKK